MVLLGKLSVDEILVDGRRGNFLYVYSRGVLVGSRFSSMGRTTEVISSKIDQPIHRHLKASKFLVEPTARRSQRRESYLVSGVSTFLFPDVN